MDAVIEYKLEAGWGVVRVAPWHLAGVFETSGEAEAKVAEMGAGYTIRYGETRPNSNEFVSEDRNVR